MTVPVTPGRGESEVSTKKVGPVKIDMGTRTERGLAGAEAPRALRLKVAALTHITEGCVPRQ